MDLYSLDSLASLHETDAVRARYGLRNVEVMTWVSKFFTLVALINLDGVTSVGTMGVGLKVGLVFVAALLSLIFGRLRRRDRDPAWPRLQPPREPQGRGGRGPSRP